MPGLKLDRRHRPLGHERLWSQGPRTNWAHSSWVTGDSPAVQSLYSRILARNPAIRGTSSTSRSTALTSRRCCCRRRRQWAEADAGARRRPGHRQRHCLRHRQSQAVPGGVRPRARDRSPPDCRTPASSSSASSAAPGPGQGADAQAADQGSGRRSGPCDFIDRNGEIRLKQPRTSKP